MQDFEKLGQFYLGRRADLEANRPTDELLLYDSKDLVTHALCLGMTGSGKTGLCLALIEEAAIDGVPALIVDPKGDLGNLLLTFPDLAPEDFAPWVDEDEARRKGKSRIDFAAEQAALWKSGLASWGRTVRASRVSGMRQNSRFTHREIRGCSSRFSSHSPHQLRRLPATPNYSATAFKRRRRACSPLLVSMPIPSRAANISCCPRSSDRRGRKVGTSVFRDHPADSDAACAARRVMEVDAFFPPSDRFALAMSLNNLLAAPGFDAWMQGEPLDIGRLLHTQSGKPRISICSIAHLSDAERMFFVSLLFNETVGWMRNQSGTTSLRALLYMDEIAGYFPPVANPPSEGSSADVAQTGACIWTGDRSRDSEFG